MRGALAAFVAIVTGVLPLQADLGRPPEVPYENLPYDGRFIFTRLRFTPSQWGPGGYIWGLDLKWNHDYPRAESHFTRILMETTTIDVALEGSNILALDDPELFRYPVAYLCEPGFWTLTDDEAEALRSYLLKGGFLILDDFRGGHWYNLEDAMSQVLPDARFVELSPGHPIFDSFFRIDQSVLENAFYRMDPPVYYGIFEDNDPSKRLMVIANYNNDIGEFWEWSDTGFIPIELNNEAYKLGVNYVVYGITH